MKNITDYDYYLFDADGTLMDTTELICRSFDYIYRHYARVEISREVILAGFGKPLHTVLEEQFPGKNAKEIEELKKAYRDYQISITSRYITLFLGVEQTLKELKKQGKKLAVVTSRRKESLLFLFRELELTSWFDLFITPESTTEHKPAPAPALEGMKQLNASPEKTLFIGDARWDIECAAAAGIDSCFVLWSHEDPEKLPVKPTYTISKMEELLGK